MEIVATKLEAVVADADVQRERHLDIDCTVTLGLATIPADKRDGKPLNAKEGPFVAPGDTRAARWVRQVIALKVIAVQ